MVLAGIKVPDTVLVRDAIDLSRSASEPFLFNHAMRSWLFGVLLSESAERAPDAELLAVATILHDLGLTDRYAAENRFEVDGANAARSFLKGARHLEAADASCLGCHRASYHTIYRSSQRARSDYDPFRNNGGCSGGRP
jgi:HD superfamily phosphodiesterase